MSAIAQPLTIARIALALSQVEYPLPPALYPDLPLIEDWLCLQDGLILRVHGRIHEAAAPARPRLSAAVIAVETAPGRIIRCVDGDYRLGQPHALPAETQADGPTPPRRPISWERFCRRVDLVQALLQRQVEGTG